MNGVRDDDGGSLPDSAHLAALAGVKGLGPRRLGLLLSWHHPREALAVVNGDAAPAAPLAAAWPSEFWEHLRVASSQRNPAACHSTCVEWGISVVGWGHRAFPNQLLNDPAPPAVLFMRGDPSVLGRRRVGIIGTRNATRAGTDTAHVLGRELTHHHIAVVSGLAKGIDGAAHRGVLSVGGAPIGVVANGLDQPYPAVHRALWEQVAECGLLMSEWPPGTTPEAFRFPLRNRIIAALSEVVVVVESRERGGSLSTVREAATRDVQVMAVPGSPMVRASSGTNQLLCDGAAPVTGVDDVLMALGLDTRRSGDRVHEPRPAPDDRSARVIELCRLMPRTLDDLVSALDLSVSEVAMLLARLERDGWIAETGGWFQVIGAWSGLGSDRGRGGDHEDLA